MAVARTTSRPWTRGARPSGAAIIGLDDGRAPDAGAEVIERGRVKLVLLLEHARGEDFRRVAGSDADFGAAEDRAVVERLGDDVDRAAGDEIARLDGATMRVEAF